MVGYNQGKGSQTAYRNADLSAGIGKTCKNTIIVVYPLGCFLAESRVYRFLQVHLIDDKRKDGEIPSQASPCCM